jgi:hypothetical protein
MSEDQDRLTQLSEYADHVRGRINVPKNDRFSRADVVRAFNSAFEMIGGVPRLALWAHENEGDFFKLYSKLLPSATVVDLNVKVAKEAKELTIEQLEEIVARADALSPAPIDVEYTHVAR